MYVEELGPEVVVLIRGRLVDVAEEEEEEEEEEWTKLGAIGLNAGGFFFGSKTGGGAVVYI